MSNRKRSIMLHPVVIRFSTYIGMTRQTRNSAFSTATWNIKIKKAFSCNILSVPNCHVTRRLHEGWDTARLPKPRQGKSRGRGRVRTTDLSVTVINSFGKRFIYWGARWLKWLEREFTDRKVRGSNPTSVPRLPLFRLGKPGGILWVPWQLSTGRVLRLNDLFIFSVIVEILMM
ncbi:hypothetical protein CSKR_107403 [Clonorchis sinensis]|uniref:Uncharacterized protein n=1 Tax=Clonorchis sinensis TaxID=79923 RepID=A0A3R7CFI8_CLOSI|nr:hypothetical protein CSKR_107403 [Clonorchis sinensis]